MLAWTIEHALNARALDHLVLSTDGETLKAIGKSYGVSLIDRPDDLAHDTATVDSAARHAVSVHEQLTGTRVDAAVILYGNIPVRPADLTDRAVNKLFATGCDSVQSVYAVGKMHPYWMKQVGGDAGDELTMYQDNHIYRRQDLPPVYMLDGGIIAVLRDSLFTQAEGEPHAFLARPSRDRDRTRRRDGRGQPAGPDRRGGGASRSGPSNPRRNPPHNTIKPAAFYIFSSTLRTLSAMVCSRSVRVPIFSEVEMRGTPCSCNASWQCFTASIT